MRNLMVLGFLPWLSVCTSAQDAAGNPEPSLRGPGIIAEIQQFSKSLGFEPTRNFQKESHKLHAYFRCYYTGKLELPDSYDGLRLAHGTEDGCRVDGHKYDVFFYPIEAVASGKAPVTSSLSQATGERLAVVVAHEDFHAVVHELPSPLGEAATTLAGFLTAVEFAKARFGELSEMYRNLSQEAELFLLKARMIKAYYANLNLLYATVRDGKASESAALERKQQLFDELRGQCQEIQPQPRSFDRCPAVFNNAGLAFDMTYSNYYPLMYQLYVTLGRNLKATIGTLKRVAGMKSLGEDRLVAYLQDLAQPGDAPRADAQPLP